MATKELKVLLQELDQANINKQHIKIIVASFLNCTLEFFDFYIVGFVLAFIVGPWKLTYGQSSLVLWSAGLGAVFGAFSFGALADRIGRKATMVAAVLTFSVPTGLLYFTPEGNWIYFTACRFTVGVGVGGLVTVLIPVLQECVPARYRGVISGCVLSSAVMGTLIASISAGYLTPLIGWRGLFVIGFAAALLTLVLQMWIPESPRWLVSKGRYSDARKSIGWILGSQAEELSGLPEQVHASELEPPPKVRWIEIFSYPRSLICSWFIQFGSQTVTQGFTLWATTILVLLLGISPARAAQLFIWVTLGGLAGRYFWAFMSEYIGRRKAGFLAETIGGTLLMVAAYTYRLYWHGVPVLWILMIAIYASVDGAVAIVGGYVSEVWPRHLRASGHGSTYGFASFGKILGPMVLALFAGSGNIVTPRATLNAVSPALLFWGGTIYVVAILFLCGYETKGKTLEEIERMITRKKTKSPAELLAKGTATTE
jgi:putative MFS transporter